MHIFHFQNITNKLYQKIFVIQLQDEWMEAEKGHADVGVEIVRYMYYIP